MDWHDAFRDENVKSITQEKGTTHKYKGTSEPEQTHRSQSESHQSRIRVTSESRPSHVKVTSKSHPSHIRVITESHH